MRTLIVIGFGIMAGALVGVVPTAIAAEEYLVPAISLKIARPTAEVPARCQRIRLNYVRNVQHGYGPNAPVAALASQMFQESGCDPSAKSAFADGLTQFTPATASWIGSRYPDLALSDAKNPTWAARAQGRYMRFLVDRSTGETECDRWWMGKWGYNGGEGWVIRDQKLALAKGANPRRHVEVEPFNAGRHAAAFRENRDYPHKIIERWQPMFIAAGWGSGVCL